MENDSFEKIAENLEGAESVHIFPHENPDGDAIGSAFALGSMLKGMGKSVRIFIDEPLPDNIAFLDRKAGGEGLFSVFDGEEEESPDVSVLVDCSGISRIEKREELFKTGAFSICLDHHKNDERACDLNHIEPDAGATGELVFMLMEAMGHELTKDEAEALFTAITTDTGNFQYSNTSKRTHEIACSLYDAGIDVAAVSEEIYQNVSKQKLALEGLAVSRIRYAAGGRIGFTEVTGDMLEASGARMSDAEPVVDKVRSVKGVEIAFVFKEKEEGDVFVSMRAKGSGNVRRIAVKFGGGGHDKAAGCTLKGTTLEEAEEAVIKAAEESIE